MSTHYHARSLFLLSLFYAFSLGPFYLPVRKGCPYALTASRTLEMNSRILPAFMVMDT